MRELSEMSARFYTYSPKESDKKLFKESRIHSCISLWFAKYLRGCTKGEEREREEVISNNEVNSTREKS